MAKFKLEPNDGYVGICAEIYITRNNCLAFHCTVCYKSTHASYAELLEHIIKDHSFDGLSKYKTPSNDERKLCPNVGDNSQNFHSHHNTRSQAANGLETKLDQLLEAVSSNTNTMAKTLQTVTTTNSKVEAMAKRLCPMNYSSKFSERESVENSDERPALQPIDSFEEADELNNEIKKNSAIKDLWFDHLTDRFGTIGQHIGAGLNVAHKSIDLLFSRPFLTKCSWSGVAIVGEKIAFKQFDGIMDLFYNAVKAADPVIAKEEIIHFLRTQIANSQRRAAVTANGGKVIREPHHKKRTKVKLERTY